MSFSVAQSSSLLYISPSRGGTSCLTLGSRDGEVNVRMPTAIERFFFQKVSYSPFSESLYAASATNCTAKRQSPSSLLGRTSARQQNALCEQSSCIQHTWVTGEPLIAAMEILRLFLVRCIDEQTSSPSMRNGDRIGSLRGAVAVLECRVRGVYPWGCLDLVRNEEISGEKCADWSVFGATALHSSADLERVLECAMGFSTMVDSRSRCPIVQINVSCGADASAVQAASYTFSYSASLRSVCRVFATSADPLQDAFLRSQEGRWTDSPLFKFIVPPSARALRRFVLVTCVSGEATALTSTLDACRFASCGARSAAPGAPLASSLPSPLAFIEAERSLAASSCAADSVGQAADLFRDERGNESVNAPVGRVVTGAAPVSDECDGVSSSLPFFGDFMSTTASGAAQRCSDIMASPAAAPRAERSSARAAVGSRGTAQDGITKKNSSLPYTADAILTEAWRESDGAAQRLESELLVRVREKEARAEEAVRSAEQRMAHARALESSARRLERQADAQIASLKANYDREARRLKEEELALQQRRSQADKQLSALLERTAEVQDEIEHIGLDVQAATSEFEAKQRAIDQCKVSHHKLCRETRALERWRAQLSARFAAHMQCSEALFVNYSLRRSDLLGTSVAAAVFSSVDAGLRQRRASVESATQELREVSGALIGAKEKHDEQMALYGAAELQCEQQGAEVAAQLCAAQETLRALGDSVVTARAKSAAALREAELSNAAAREKEAIAQMTFAARTNQQQREALGHEETLARSAVELSWQHAMQTTASALHCLSHLMYVADNVCSAEVHARVQVISAEVSDWTTVHEQMTRELLALTERASARVVEAQQAEEQVEALKRAKAHLERDMDSALQEIQELSMMRASLEGEFLTVMSDLETAVGEVQDAETAMLRNSDRSLKALQLSEAESAARTSELLDRCTALIEARSSTRRNSISSSYASYPADGPQ